MSHLMTKPTKWFVRPAKTQISLAIRPVWSVFTFCMKKAWILSYPFEVSCMDSSWKNSWHMFFFFLSELSPFLELRRFEKIRMKSGACHILCTVPATVLKFHIWIPDGKIADPFFTCPSYLPFWSYAPLKKSEWNLVSKISRKVFELGAWNLVSW